MSQYDTENLMVFDNEIVSLKFQDSLITQLDLMNFATPDYSLTENPGMVKKIRTYVGTGSAEDLEMTEGNTEDIGANFTETEYRVITTQSRFPYYDEQLQADPNAIDAGLAHQSEDMVNDFTKKAIAEFNKATNIQYGCTWTFDNVVDAISSLPDEQNEGLFLLINRKEVAAFRKNLKDSLQYVTDFVRVGYIGSVCGCPIYVSDAVPAGKAYLATKEAVTVFIKKGNEVEQKREPNTRKTEIFLRKCSVVALTNAKKLIRLTATADPRTGYTVLTEQPEDWATGYTGYYTYNYIEDKMDAVTGTSAPEFVAGKYWDKD